MTVIYWIGQCQNTGFTFSLLQQWLCDVIFCIVHCTLLYMTIVARDITPSLEQKCPLTNFKALWLYPTRLSSRHSYSHACSDAHDVNNLHFCVIFILLSSIPFGLLESVNLSVWVFLDRFYTDFSGLSSSRSLTGWAKNEAKVPVRMRSYMGSVEKFAGWAWFRNGIRPNTLLHAKPVVTWNLEIGLPMWKINPRISNNLYPAHEELTDA